MVAGTGRFLEALSDFRFDDTAGTSLAEFLDRDTMAYLRDFRFGGDVDGYPEGELYFPGSPVLSVHGSFAECVILETLAPVDLQSRHRCCLRRRADGQRRPRAAVDGHGLAPDP